MKKIFVFLFGLSIILGITITADANPLVLGKQVALSFDGPETMLLLGTGLAGLGGYGRKRLRKK